MKSEEELEREMELDSEKELARGAKLAVLYEHHALPRSTQTRLRVIMNRTNEYHEAQAIPGDGRLASRARRNTTKNLIHAKGLLDKDLDKAVAKHGLASEVRAMLEGPADDLLERVEAFKRGF